MADSSGSRAGSRWELGGVALILGLLLGSMFAGSFVPEQVLFSSDGPLGANMAAFAAIPDGYTGVWQDLNWIGAWTGNAAPNITTLLLWILRPLYFAKFYAPLSLLILGICVWLFFRQLGFGSWVAVLGAVAATLNTDFFSYACWGLGTLPLSVAWTFLALTALTTKRTNAWWLRAVVAGGAVGMAIMEGFDSGAIFSLYIAAFVVLQSWGGARGIGVRLWQAGWRVGLVAVCAAVVATAALSMLVSTQVQGVVGMQQDPRSKTQRWEDATQWSLPKIETLRVIVPGLFGYRMDSPEGGNYWGRVGERPGIMARHSGAGVYGGVLVVMLAGWVTLRALRRDDPGLSADDLRTIRFWAGAAVISLLLSWGKHAPFYQLIYALPYFSTIRNPIKFMHPFHISLVILFGYALQALVRAYGERARNRAASLKAQLKSWWATAAPFERKWVVGSLAVLGAGLLGWLLYAASLRDVENHLRAASFPAELVPVIARFSLSEVGWTLLFLAAAGVVVTLVAAGPLGGGRMSWGFGCLALLLVADLMRANYRWVVHFNYRDKYATNPIIELLRNRAFEHRVMLLPLQLGEQFSLFQQLYHGDWLQHLFQYYNVQSLNVIQEPRQSVDNTNYRAALEGQGEAGFVRMWQLTNTRYFLGTAGGLVDALNEKLDPLKKRFRLHTAFTLGVERPGGPIVVQTNTAGPFALIEFEGALPRAKLYARWVVETNLDLALKRLVDPGFDPTQAVVVGTPPAASMAPAETNSAPGHVEYVRYSPKSIELRAKADGPAVLVLNDKYDPQWRVWVDGEPRPLLRCNYLMRGVEVGPGEHRIEFRFRTSSWPLVVSLVALAAVLGLGVALGLGGGNREPRERAAAADGPGAK